MEWNSNERWRAQIERKLNQIGSMVNGNQKFQADRVSDVIEQVAELRAELQAFSERLNQLSNWAFGAVEESDGD